ncbi:3-dehydroquinate dehydratase [Pseudohyphozyma bogoriensis]|nr:3-dehydroquinate dehydratase [Pseudohyphozyma bogoriensis]
MPSVAIPNVKTTRIGPQDPSLGRTRPRQLDTVLLLHGPSSNLFGERNPAYYGTASLDDFEKFATAAAAKLGLKVVCAQTNHEGVMIDHLHAARTYGAIVMNYAIRDAIESIDTPVIEIHLSNLYTRAVHEKHRGMNVTAAAAAGYIGGCGILGYDLAMQRAKILIEEQREKAREVKAKL